MPLGCIIYFFSGVGDIACMETEQKMWEQNTGFSKQRSNLEI